MLPGADDGSGAAPPEMECYASVTLPGRVTSVRIAADFIIRSARQMQVPAAFHSPFETAIVEALNNAVKHGTTDLRPEAVIACEWERVGDRFTLRIFDQGPGFTLPSAPRPAWSAEDTASIPEGGFGISIIQSVFPTVRTITRPGEFGLEMALTF